MTHHSRLPYRPNRGSTSSSGFTLVEVLTVIVIIGILAGIAIPAINAALRGARNTAIRTDVDVLSQAIEAYKLQHGAYPPDFSDWAAVERHFRKAFPSIDNNELRILAQFTHYNSNSQRTNGTGTSDPRTSSAFDHFPHAIDRAEALVLCLGGFSSDKKKPFTGPGWAVGAANRFDTGDTDRRGLLELPIQLRAQRRLLSISPRVSRWSFIPMIRFRPTRSG